MSHDPLPPAVRQFLSRYVRSVEQLEILLLLRSQPERPRTAAEVYEIVRSSQPSIAERLEAFTANGFLTKIDGTPPAYRYAPKGDLTAAIDATAAAYQTWRVRVIEVIFAPEADPVQSFADAFKIRKQ